MIYITFETVVISNSLFLAKGVDTQGQPFINGIDGTGQPIVLSAVSNAQHGTVVLNSNNTITFNPSHTGQPSFDYTLTFADGSTEVLNAILGIQ